MNAIDNVCHALEGSHLPLNVPLKVLMTLLFRSTNNKKLIAEIIKALKVSLLSGNMQIEIPLPVLLVLISVNPVDEGLIAMTIKHLELASSVTLENIFTTYVQQLKIPLSVLIVAFYKSKQNATIIDALKLAVQNHSFSEWEKQIGSGKFLRLSSFAMLLNMLVKIPDDVVISLVPTLSENVPSNVWIKKYHLDSQD